MSERTFSGRLSQVWDLYFGPTAPDEGDTNWVQTIPSRHWFSYFRLYGPLQGYFDRSWKLGDITLA